MVAEQDNANPAMALLLQQLREDEQRLVKLRHIQNVGGSFGVTGARPFDFPLPGEKQSGNRPELPTPPQRRGGNGNDKSLGGFRIPIAPALTLQQWGAAGSGPRGEHESKKKMFARGSGFLQPIPPPVLPNAAHTGDATCVPKPPTPRIPSRQGDGGPDVEASQGTGQERVSTPRSVSSRSSQRTTSSMCGASCDESRLARLENMLAEERVGRLEMLEKVNALSSLLADQNKKLAANRRRNRFIKR